MRCTYIYHLTQFNTSFYYSTLLSACSDSTQKKQYSITTYFTSFDSSSNSMGNEGKKFKYSYEEYNSDSNLIYQELYATTDRFGNDWESSLRKQNSIITEKRS